MYAQQICGDYYLFFDRKKAELGMRNLRVYSEEAEPNFMKKMPTKLESDLKDFNDKNLGRKVVVLFEENEGENGINASVSQEGDLTIKINELANDFLNINNELSVPLKGDGIVRMNYGISSFFSQPSIRENGTP